MHVFFFSTEKKKKDMQPKIPTECCLSTAFPPLLLAKGN